MPKLSTLFTAINQRLQSRLVHLAKLLVELFPNVHPNWYTAFRLIYIVPLFLLLRDEPYVTSSIIIATFVAPIILLVMRRYFVTTLVFLAILGLELSLIFLERYNEAALLLFILGAFLDLVDGPVARYTRQTSRTGALLDPLADKLMFMTALVAFYEEINVYIFWAILILEALLLVEHLIKFFVFRHESQAKRAEVQKSGIWGKVKFVLEVAGSIALFLIAYWSPFMYVANIILLLAFPLAFQSLFQHLLSYRKRPNS